MSEAIVAQIHELEDGQMKQVAVGEAEVLLAKVGGEFFAIGARCNHWGAPLAEGVLSGKRVICPWHHACYNVETGKLLEPPALNDQRKYEVLVRGENVVVRVPDTEARPPDVPEGSEQPDGAEANADPRVFAIVGAGAAGSAAAEMLRREGFRGRIVLITRENRLPYDRPNLSKDYLAGTAEEAWMPLRDEAFYREKNIELWRGREVTAVSVAARTITFSHGKTYRPDALLLAPGGTPRSLDVPGAKLDGVLLLRTFDDADRIIAATAQARRVVIVGASFIGMEAAAFLKARELDITVVAPDAVPFEKAFGEKIGRWIQQKHEAKGTRFYLGHTVARIEGNGRVERVVLDTGEVLDADLVLVGIGVRPATDFVEYEDKQEDGGLPVDATLQLADGVWAAGDVARFPDPHTNAPVRIEHWRLAQQHGRFAAKQMVGTASAYDAVPFFWTTQHDAGVRYVGVAKEWDEILYDGDVDSGSFLAYFVKDDKVLAAAGSGRDQAMAAFHECMRLGKLPSVDELRQGSVDWQARLG